MITHREGKTGISYRGMLPAIFAIVMLFATLANAQEIPATTLCNTGLTRGSLPPQGCTTSTLITPINPLNGGPIVDGNWELAVPYPSVPYTQSAPDPCVFVSRYRPAPVSAPWPDWYNPLDGLSQWIEPLGGGSTPPGWYIYRTPFIVPSASTGYHYILFVDGVFMADDYAVAIFVEDPAGNNKSCKQVATFTSNSQQYAWNQFKFSGPVIPNTAAFLYFVVYNQYSSSTTQNPTGLRVEFIGPYFVAVQ